MKFKKNCVANKLHCNYADFRTDTKTFFFILFNAKCNEIVLKVRKNYYEEPGVSSLKGVMPVYCVYHVQTAEDMVFLQWCDEVYTCARISVGRFSMIRIFRYAQRIKR